MEPPGTGKNLLASAVAGEAGLPFFSCAAPEFVELFVVSRVRDLFEKTKSKAPCIVLIDEVFRRIGWQRGAGLGGGNGERSRPVIGC
ncbi:hypothetical protein RJ639_032357 [Escallonia herrerae]|uniref:ATPase AAA-type core domain-containing protein n=1 Tax=Escallonia herrerae TaxID=1293975 RepID=A0AA88WWC1_9ASTE|nr:hypothetical protein RJ639_032357 [Escallonia herrerae]